MYFINIFYSCHKLQNCDSTSQGISLDQNAPEP